MARKDDVQGQPPASRLSGEPRETSGVTTSLLLAYLDRVGGRALVEDVLSRCGLAGYEAELRDENSWCSWQTKIELFEATVAATSKPQFLEEMAALALDLNVAPGLKVALRTLGTPQVVYRSIVRANGRFSSSHVMGILSLGRSSAEIRYADVSEARRFHPLDCHYSAAMLRIVPELFGLPRAELRHLRCVGRGDAECVYVLHWREHVSILRRAVATATAAGAALIGSAALLPSTLPAAAALAAGGAGTLALTEVRRHRTAWQALQREAEDSAEVAARLIASLQDLASDLRLEEVLVKVTRNAQAAMGGREFALLVRDGERYGAQSSSGLPPATLAALEAWCDSDPRVGEQSIVLDAVGALPALATLTAEALPLQSLASAPLSLFGESFGVLIALGTQSHAFLPRDIEVLQSFASQVSIALHNARRYHLTKTQADCDALTGLLNHRSFHDAVERALAAPGPRRGCVVLLDLDNFKQVNDEDGHGAGDAVLQATARVLSGSCRSDDLAFRVGGDEFALLLAGVDEPAAAAVAGRVCAEIAELDRRLGASAGVAEIAPGLEKEDVVRRADRLLYRAKRAEQRAGRTAVSAGGAARVTVEVLLATLELHHAATAAHSRAVAELSDQVAARLGADAAERLLTRQIALLHDVGKLGLTPDTLDRAGPLDHAAWAIVHRHPDIAAEVILRVPGLEALSSGVRRVQERLDGSGYPSGLVADQIPRPARIVGVCDAFDAMTREHPYRPARSGWEAIAELRRLAGRQFDPAAVEALAAVTLGVASAAA